MKKIKLVVVAIIGFAITTIFSIGCSVTNSQITEKSGVQLWGENCVRCHNSPAPNTFSDVQWEVAVSHMRVRALITQEETDKILEFLKSAN